MLTRDFRSAPEIVTAISDGIECIARQRIIERIEHYLDDYVFC